MAVPVGVTETTLEPVRLDLFGRDQHLLVFGDPECGKTNLLRLIADGIVARCSADDVVFAVFDPRRTQPDAVPEPYRGGYAPNATLAANLAAGVVTELQRRTGGEEPATGGPRAYHRGLGPRVVVIVDDYDLLTSGGQQPLAPFVPLLPVAAEIGLHVVVARRVAGAGRALYDPFLMALLDNGTTGS